MKENKYTIIVSSFDGSSDTWSPFFSLFFKFWPDIDAQIYLMANKKSYKDTRVNTFNIINDMGWASNMLEILSIIKTPYIVYMQDDYFLKSTVNNKYIKYLVNNMNKWNASYIRLIPSPKPDLIFSIDNRLGIISKGQKYRVSLQASIWSVSDLISIIKSGESGWDMEEFGSIRSSKLDKIFLSVNKDPALDYYPQTAIKKGKWMYGAIDLCKKEGIYIDTSKREIFSRSKYILGQIKGSNSVQSIKKIPVFGGFLKYLFNLMIK